MKHLTKNEKNEEEARKQAEKFAKEFLARRQDYLYSSAVDATLKDRIVELEKENTELRKTIESDYFVIKEDWKGIAYKDKKIAKLERENKDLKELIEKMKDMLQNADLM